MTRTGRYFWLMTRVCLAALSENSIPLPRLNHALLQLSNCQSSTAPGWLKARTLTGHCIVGSDQTWIDQYEPGLALSGEATLPRNLLLRSLPSQDLERLYPFLHRVPLTPRRVLQHAGVSIEHLYFVE